MKAFIGKNTDRDVNNCILNIVSLSLGIICFCFILYGSVAGLFHIIESIRAEKEMEVSLCIKNWRNNNPEIYLTPRQVMEKCNVI